MGVVNETETQYQLGAVLRGPGRRWASAARAAAVAAAVLCSQAPWASADERMFTWSYEAKSLPQGTWEWEQWATLQDGKASGRWSTLNLADEIEYGISDRLTASVYLHTFYQGNSAVPGTPNDHEVGFRKMSSEWTYRLTDPSADAVGIMLYEEPEVSSTLLEFETKLVISKQIGPWTFAYNFTWEPELLRAADPHQSPQWTLEHEFWNTAGVSYGLTPQVAVGAEVVQVARFDTYQRTSTRATYAGPNLHVQSSSWWATLTFLRQVNFGRGLEYTDDDNTRFSIRLIFGVTF